MAAAKPAGSVAGHRLDIQHLRVSRPASVVAAAESHLNPLNVLRSGMPPSVGVIHPGAMGAWQMSARRTGWPRGCDVLISVCPHHAATEVALTIRGFHGIFVEANAVSPRNVRYIAATAGSAGALVVDGGIIRPPPGSTTSGGTRIYLAGPEAATVARLFDPTPIDARVIGGQIGAASPRLPSRSAWPFALKMAYAAWTNGNVALVLAIRALARATDIDTDLLREWAESQPDLLGREQQARRSAAAKRLAVGRRDGRGRRDLRRRWSARRFPPRRSRDLPAITTRRQSPRRFGALTE
jgi:hypothetical protein